MKTERTKDGGARVSFAPTDFHTCPVCHSRVLIVASEHGGFLGHWRTADSWQCNGVEMRIYPAVRKTREPRPEVVATLERPYTCPACRGEHEPGHCPKEEVVKPAVQSPAPRLTKKQVAAIHADLVAAAQAVAEKHGVTIKEAGGIVGDTFATLKVEVALRAENGTPNGQYADAWAKLHELYGFAADDLGRSFGFRGDTWRIVGLNSRSAKFPVVVEKNGDPRPRRMSTELVRSILALKGGK